MPFFRSSPSSPFEELVARATNENNVTEDWSLIMDICDKTVNYEGGAKFCLEAIAKRLYSNVPRVVMQALTLLDTCVKNCGKKFMLEVSSRNFVAEITKLLSKMQPVTAIKLKQLLRRWAEIDFKDDNELCLIVSLYYKLKSENVEFPPDEEEQKPVAPVCTDPNAVGSQEEEEAIIKALTLSLKETKKSNTVIVEDVPSCNGITTELTKVRAVYDFEAVEDNELTLKAGEIVIVLDKSNGSWWKGSNQRGEGYFPANFVSENLDAEIELLNTADEVTTVKEVEIEPSEPAKIDEDKIQKALDWLNDTDPTIETEDSDDLLRLERDCSAMAPLIEKELREIDKKCTLLDSANQDLMDALDMFYSLESSGRNVGNISVDTRYLHLSKQDNTPSVANNVNNMQQQFVYPVAATVKTDAQTVDSVSQNNYAPFMKHVMFHNLPVPTTTLPSSSSSQIVTDNNNIGNLSWYQPDLASLPPVLRGQVVLQQMPVSYLNQLMINQSLTSSARPNVSHSQSTSVLDDTSSEVQESATSNFRVPVLMPMTVPSKGNTVLDYTTSNVATHPAQTVGLTSQNSATGTAQSYSIAVARPSQTVISSPSESSRTKPSVESLSVGSYAEHHALTNSVGGINQSNLVPNVGVNQQYGNIQQTHVNPQTWIAVTPSDFTSTVGRGNGTTELTSAGAANHSTKLSGLECDVTTTSQ